MRSPSLESQRLITVVAATVVALACGTNYAYSAWAPQFRERMKLTSTQINLIGTAGNLGTYASGIPIGLLVDAKGPRPGTLIGAISLFVGYFPIHRAYAAGPGSMGMPALFFFSFLTGLGSCSAFAAAIKTSASNFPYHRGSATAFPLSAYGLSAVFFSSLSAMAFRGDTTHFLLLLAVGTPSMILVSSLFLRILPHSSYSALPHQEPTSRSRQGKLERTASAKTTDHSTFETGTQKDFSRFSNLPDVEDTLPSSSSASAAARTEQTVSNTAAEETSSLMARSETAAAPSPPLCGRDSICEEDRNTLEPRHNSLYADVRGVALLQKIEFWQLFALMGTLTGIGLMTINNVGNDVRALWKYYDDSAGRAFLQRRQAVHVSVLSMLSFVGRLVSGIGSDILVKKFHLSRLWCIFASCILFCISQLAATQVSYPYHLIVVSSITGMAYGMLFGVFPSIVSHTFGIDGLSQNWGVMTLAAVLGGYVFNILYGSIYDRNSVVGKSGERECTEGVKCYSASYFITFYAGLAAAAITLWSIWHEKRIIRERQEEKKLDRDRIE